MGHNIFNELMTLWCKSKNLLWQVHYIIHYFHCMTLNSEIRIVYIFEMICQWDKSSCIHSRGHNTVGNQMNCSGRCLGLHKKFCPQLVAIICSHKLCKSWWFCCIFDHSLTHFKPEQLAKLPLIVNLHFHLGSLI